MRKQMFGWIAAGLAILLLGLSPVSRAVGPDEKNCGINWSAKAWLISAAPRLPMAAGARSEVWVSAAW
jgi:hypothetical protein